MIKKVDSSLRMVSTSAILKPIFRYYHSIGPKEQENHHKNLVFFPKTESPSLQSLRIVLL